MADNYINPTGLQIIKNWIVSTFAKDSDLDDLSSRVDEIVAEGGEPNTIETVKVNGTALTPDAQKAVDVTVPTKVSDLTNDGDGTEGSAFATEDYVDENGGKIDSISVNGTAQTIDQNKNVDLAVPDIFVGSFVDKPSAVIADRIEGNNYFNGISVQEDTVQNGAYGVLTVTANSGSGSNVIQARRIPYWASMVSYVDENSGKIDSISVNGTAQTIDANKNVDLDVPEYLYKSDSGLTSFAIGAYAQYVDQTERVKEGISIRDWKHTDGGTEYPVIEVQFFKENGHLGPGKRVPSWVAMKDYVASVLPANVSDLTNDSGYQTASDVSGAIDAAVASAFTYKGAVATQSALPSTGNKTGDVYDVQDTGVNYAWNGTAWDALGQYVDTSILWSSQSGQTNSLVAMTASEIDAILSA